MHNKTDFKLNSGLIVYIIYLGFEVNGWLVRWLVPNLTDITFKPLPYTPSCNCLFKISCK